MACGWSYPQYVAVADKKKQAEKLVEKLRKKGKNISPVVIEGKKIDNSFWGKLWCQNLAKYSDYENRLSRARSYAKNVAIVDLQIDNGEVNAQVNGSSKKSATKKKPATKKKTKNDK